jgi:enoyl-[acyl-carrier-protein] reductase (NADH)
MRFKYLLIPTFALFAANTPLKENIDSQDVGELAAFLCGPGGRHITGANMFVDSGAHIM